MEVKRMEPGRTRPQVKEQWLFPEFETQGGDEVKEVKNKRKRSKK